MDSTYEILIVDDNATIRQRLSYELQTYGYVPIEAVTFQGALEELKTCNPAVAIIDLVLEDVSGLDLIKPLREHLPEIECIILTGNASQTSAMEAINLGVFGYVEKSSDFNQLMVLVRRAIEKTVTLQRLRESEERYRALFERTNDGIFIMNLDGTHLDINPQVAEMLGYSVEEILDKSALDFIVPEEKENANLMKDILLKEGVLPVYQRTFRRKDGTTFPAEINIALVYDSDGKPSHLHSVVRDISERKQAEQQQLDLSIERERMQVLAHFITQTSHEFRTPLTVIDTSLYLLDRLADSDQQKTLIDKIGDQVKNITELVDALTTMAWLDSIQELTTDAVDFSQVVLVACEVQQQILEQKNSYYAVELKRQPLMVEAESFHLQQAIAAIIDNAIRFSPEASTITIRVDGKDGNAIVEIIDSGCGIGDEDLPHIFERFYRADKTGSTRGFGLGLPTARKILDLHHGTIEVESEINQGSRFRVIVPLIEDAPLA